MCVRRGGGQKQTIKHTVTVRALLETTLATKVELPFSSLPLFLALPGEPPIPWSRWKESFKTFTTAIRLADADDARLKALLIHSLGSEGQHIFQIHGPAETYDNCFVLPDISLLHRASWCIE